MAELGVGGLKKRVDRVEKKRGGRGETKWVWGWLVGA